MTIKARAVHSAFFWSAVVLSSILVIIIIMAQIKAINNYALASVIVAGTTIKSGSQPISSMTDKIGLAVDCVCEKEFTTEYPVIWSGQVIATFVSGLDIGVKRYGQGLKYKQFYVETKGNYWGYNGKDVRVEGRLTGVTCAYANTVFGECVADVIADKVTLIK